MATHPISRMQEVNTNDWLADFKQRWRQGEHVAIIGPTGTGKTTISLDIVSVRDYVVVFAVKRKDETLDLFKRGGYKVIKSWPPDLYSHKVILWEKPGSLTDDLGKQALAIHEALNKIYLAGGWCVYFDEAGYIAGTLGLGRDIGVLLNQGRSAYLSIVCAMTRPSSVVARIPKEALNQPRHRLVFKFEDEREQKACAEIVGINWRTMLEIQQDLGKHDFVYIGGGQQMIVRNTKTKGGK